MEILELLKRHQQGNLPYPEAVALFAQLYPDAKVLQNVFKKEDAFSRSKLKEKLSKRLQELEAVKEQNKFQSFTPLKFQKINLEILPKDLREKYARTGAIIREIADLRGRLKSLIEMPNQKLKCYEVALKIVLLTQERRGIFDQVDYYLATGTELQKEPVPQIRVIQEAPKDFEIEYELKKLRSMRSKLKKKPNQLERYNQVCEQIRQLELKRPIA